MVVAEWKRSITCVMCMYVWVLGKGICCVVQRLFVRGLQYSIIPVVTLDGIIIYDIVNSPVSDDYFYNFIKEFVVLILILFFIMLLVMAVTYNHLVQMPFTNPCPGPHSVLIMDNCCIHYGKQLCQLVEDNHCKCCSYYIAHQY